MKDLFIFPLNGNAIEALDCLIEDFNFLGFIDDTPEKQNSNPFGHKVHTRQILQKYPNAQVLAVPGSPASFMIRKKIIGGLNIAEDRLARVIHPKAIVSSNAKIGRNVLIMGGVVLTSNCEIGDHVCILPNTVVHHDSKIGDYTLIGSNVTVAGYTTIEENCYVGSGSSIINGINIGSGSLIGMGSNVIKSIPANSKAVGNPARVL